MSTVTNAILTFSILENERSRMQEVQQFFGDEMGFVSCDFSLPAHEPEFAAELQRYATPRVLNLLDPWYGGTKRLERSIQIGAFNYLDCDGLLQHVRTKVNWREPQNVQLMLCRQEEDRFTVYEMDADTEDLKRLRSCLTDLRDEHKCVLKRVVELQTALESRR